MLVMSVRLCASVYARSERIRGMADTEIRVQSTSLLRQALAVTSTPSHSRSASPSTHAVQYSHMETTQHPYFIHRSFGGTSCLWPASLVGSVWRPIAERWTRQRWSRRLTAKRPGARRRNRFSRHAVRVGGSCTDERNAINDNSTGTHWSGSGRRTHRPQQQLYGTSA